MKEKLIRLQAMLQNAPQMLAGKKAVAGFDGFVDSVVRVVNNKTEDGSTAYFDTIKDFGNYISGKSGSGFSLESEELMLKLGGNMPIMANGLAHLGIAVDCIGAFGRPYLHTAFTKMHPACTLHSFTNPGFTTAMEFNDGKIMLAQMTELNHANWDTIAQAVGLSLLKQLFTSARLICLVNWSEPDHSNNMWHGLLENIFAGIAGNPPRKFFFDLSDCSKRTPQAITKALDLIKTFGTYGNVTLSLNRNEAGILYKLFAPTKVSGNLQSAGELLFAQLDIDVLIIHTAKESLAWDKNGSYADRPVYITSPKLATGAGDNFNAGFCTAQLLGMDTVQSLILANTTSHCYMTSGESPSLNVLNDHISKLISGSL